MSSYPQIFLRSSKARSFGGFHPWVRERSIVEPASPLEPGEIVELLSSGGGWVGRGVYNSNSTIRVRLYQWNRESRLDEPWILSQLERAVQLRLQWMERNHGLSAVRLINSEGDGLSGLIVDQFGGYLVVQVTAFAMQQWLDLIVEWLGNKFSPKGILLRIDEKTASNEGMEAKETVLFGSMPEEPVVVEENGVKLSLDLASGQKTGYYLDQRSNRLRAAQWSRSGEVLDCCCYQGGFSLALAKHSEQSQITAVDSSARALEHARRNAELNGIENITFQQADCFDFLEAAVKEKRQFQTVVLDPPRMAGNRAQVAAALRAYHRLNLAAVNLLEPDGILITCSCSGRVTRSDMSGMLASVAKRTRRAVQIVESAGADFDHPVDVNCPETEYLKCFICRVS